MPKRKARIHYERVGRTVMVWTSGLLTDASLEAHRDVMAELAALSHQVDRMVVDVRPALFLLSAEGTIAACSAFGEATIAVVGLPEQMGTLAAWRDELADAGVFRLLYSEVDLAAAARWARVPVPVLSVPREVVARRSMHGLERPPV
jgi:hypothetical protein